MWRALLGLLLAHAVQEQSPILGNDNYTARQSCASARPNVVVHTYLPGRVAQRAPVFRNQPYVITLLQKGAEGDTVSPSQVFFEKQCMLRGPPWEIRMLNVRARGAARSCRGLQSHPRRPGAEEVPTVTL